MFAAATAAAPSCQSSCRHEKYKRGAYNCHDPLNMWTHLICAVCIVLRVAGVEYESSLRLCECNQSCSTAAFGVHVEEKVEPFGGTDPRQSFEDEGSRGVGFKSGEEISVALGLKNIRGQRGAETAAVAELAGSAAGPRPRQRALSPADECGAML